MISAAQGTTINSTGLKPALSVRARANDVVLDIDGAYPNGRIWPY